ncbi:MAG: aminoacyl-tRNA hydrolase [Acidimicrobiales bacterium]
MAARWRPSQRTGTPSDLLVVGLGNPGEKYAGTRHNVGLEALECLADRHGGRLKSAKGDVLADDIRIDGHRVGLVFPLTYMNESGRAVGPQVRRHGIDDDLQRLVVLHDELDLPVGRLKVKIGGGLAGHNGLKSLRDHLHSTDFVRVRIGIDRPPGPTHDYVLRRPAKADRAELDIVVETAADAVETILAEGPEAAMTRFNGAG